MLNDLLQSEVLTVAEYASRLGSAVREVGAAILEGEVQNPKMTAGGMLFFNLTDGEANLSCKVFPRDVVRMRDRLKNGDLGRVQVDRPDFYAAKGSLSLIVSQVTLAGEGELRRLRAELVAQLTHEGLCDPTRRRPLPCFPRAVGVIAGHGSDGMSDVITSLTDRWPAVRIITYPCAVQGKAAPRQLIDALATFQEQSLVDVIVMARGGGSVQDLACFDDESLCRALFACEVPVVCAIGHTDNNPVCNHVTWSAYTPSRSAEMVVPSVVEVRRTIERAHELVGGVPRKLALAEERITATASRLRALESLGVRVRDVRQASSDLTASIDQFFRTHLTEQATLASARTILERTNERLLRLATRTTELGVLVAGGAGAGLAEAQRNVTHLAELVAARDFRRRGWVLAGRRDAPVRSAADLRPGDRIELQLHDGRTDVAIERVHAHVDRSE